SEQFPSALPSETQAQEECHKQKYRSYGGKDKRNVFRRIAKVIRAVGEENITGQTAEVENDKGLQPRLALGEPIRSGGAGGIIGRDRVGHAASPPSRSIPLVFSAVRNSRAIGRNRRHP